jgi:hypothetical protein
MALQEMPATRRSGVYDIAWTVKKSCAQVLLPFLGDSTAMLSEKKRYSRNPRTAPSSSAFTTTVCLFIGNIGEPLLGIEGLGESIGECRL